LKKSLVICQIKAALLALLFVSAWFSKSAHGFFLHQDDDHLVCNIAFEKGQHLHDQRYAGNDCAFCAFVISTPEVPVFWRPVQRVVAPAFTQSEPAFYSRPSVFAGFDLTFRRGPPTRV